MTPETLTEIKRQIRRFNSSMAKLFKLWPSNGITTISVLLQNAGFYSSNRDHEGMVKELETILAILKDISEYDETSHIKKWVYEEVDLIVQGNIMSEEYSNSVLSEELIPCPMNSDEDEEMLRQEEFRQQMT